MDPSPSPSEVARVADFRAALRAFLRKSERNARQSGLTPQRYLLLLMIKGAPDGSEQSTVTELAERLQLAQSTVTELVRRAEETGLVERNRLEQFVPRWYRPAAIVQATAPALLARAARAGAVRRKRK